MVADCCAAFVGFYLFVALLRLPVSERCLLGCWLLMFLLFGDVFVICLLLVVIVVVGLLMVYLFVLVSFVAVSCWLLVGRGGFRVLIVAFRLLVDGCCASLLCALRVFVVCFLLFGISFVCCCLLWTIVV